MSSSTKCSFNNHPSVVRTKTKSTTPFLPTSLFIPFTCHATRYQSFRSCLPASLRCDWDLGRLTHKRSCLTPFSGTSTGTTSTTRECSHPSFLKLQARRIPATSTPSLRVLRLYLHLCSLVCVHNHVCSVHESLLTTHAVLSQAMQEEFRGFSYSADFA